jgi:ankyrin repeat protein
MLSAGTVVGQSAPARKANAGGTDLRLVEAAQNKEFGTVRALLKQRVDVNASQADGTTALHWAVHWDSIDTADALIRAGANVNATSDLGVFPLSLACSNRSEAMVERLLAAGASPNAALPSGETAVMTCARTGAVAAVKVLLARGANPNARETGRGQTALMWAVSGKHAAVVSVLIENGADVNARSTGAFTPLLFAARVGDLESARVLLAAGAKVNDVTPDGNSPLVVAAASMAAITARDYRLVPEPSDHEPLAILLLDKGADTAQVDQYGTTALHFAVEMGKLDLVKALLDHGANVNAQIKKGLPFRRADYVSRAYYAGATPLWLAAKNADVETMRVLVERGADPHIPSANGTTPLMVAAGLGQTDSRMPPEDRMLEAVKVALEWDRDINGVNAGGQTAVHGAASVSADTIIEFLAAQGAKIDVKDKRGQTPLDIAEKVVQRPRPSTAAVLRRLSAARSEGPTR